MKNKLKLTFQTSLLATVLLIGLSSQATLVLGPLKRESITNDPYTAYQWHFFPNGQKSLQDIDDITPQEIPLSPLSNIHWKPKDQLMQRVVKIATIDSGVDPKHPDLVSQLGTGKSFLSPDPAQNILYEDNANHGTHVLSIIAAGINNGIGVTGMTNKVEVLPLQVYDNVDEGTSGEDRSALADQGLSNNREPLPLRFANAIDYAVDVGVDLIHLSAGWPRIENHPKLVAAVQRALDEGILIVAAAGNDGNDAQIYPCAFQGVVCVGSVSLDGKISSFSNFGGHVDLYAPGEDILAAVPTFLSSDFFGIKGYDFKSGTSQAAPMVSGALAVMRGIWPELSSAFLVEKLLQSSAKLPTGERFLDFEAATSGTEMSFKPRPVFKGLEFVVGDAQAGVIELTIPWSLELKRVPDVSFISQTPGYKLVGLDVASNNVQVRLAVDSARVDSRLSFEMKVDGESFRHSVFHVRPLKVTHAFQMPETKGLHPVGLRSVANLTGDTTTQFWRTEQEESSDEASTLKLSVWTQDEESAPWVLKQRDFSGVRSLLGQFLIMRLKWRAGAPAGYVVGLIKDASNANGSKTVFRYDYLDENLRTVYRFDFEPKDAFPIVNTFDEYRFVPHSFDGEKILVPAFWGAFPVSQADINIDFFDFEDNPVRPHLFYFEPKKQGRGFQFVTRTVTHSRFEKSIRTAMGKDIRTDIVYQGPAQQQPGNYFADFDLYFFLGRGVQGQNLKIRFSDLETRDFEILPVVGGEGYNLGRQPLTSAWNLTRNKILWEPENLVVYSNFQGRSLLFEPEGVVESSLELPKDRDAIRGIVKTFRGPNADIVSLLQTKSFFRVQGQWRGKNIDEKQLLYRTTFMPGASFAQRLSPVLVGKSRRPGLLLDNTLAFSNTALVYQLHDDGAFFAPVQQSYQIPAGCLLKNVEFAQSDYHKVPVLCARENGLEVLWMVLDK